VKIGAERKKVAVLGLYLFYTNVLSDSSAPPAARTGRASRDFMADMPAPAPAARRAGAVAARTTRASEEFHPSLKPHSPEEHFDPMSIDPTLRLDLLAKVQSTGLEGGARNLFQFSTPPPAPPKGPEPKIVPKTPAEIAKALEQQKTANPTAAKPPPPPINLKYYGYSTSRADGRKKAFFLDGDDILVAPEGETVKRRYRVVRIGVNSVLMEDTESKSQQTLPLQEEAAA